MQQSHSRRRSQGREDASEASPDALAAYYKDMERKEIVERKLSKKMNGGTSIWSRKLSLKRSATAHPAAPPAQVSHQSHQSSGVRDEKRREEEESVAINHNDCDRPDWVRPMNSPRSVIPDSKDLPATHSNDVWNSVPHPSHRVRYFIHNPVGPRWYKNHHLIPPSETTPAARPPSFFSPSFPPIAASASQDRLEDPTRIAGPSRTPSNSPLPTPNSSQTRVEDRPRTRKLSETAHDVVDLLDVTDPWGTNWHHHSPYDIGLVNGAISVDVQDTRSRRSSMDQSRGRAIAPSPLSQSTSAVNLHEKPVIQIPRKLSKRRAAPAGSQDTERNAMSLPTTPLGTRPSPTNLPKRMSVAVPPIGSSMSTQDSSQKKGSVIGRLVKKFSLLTKPLSDPNKRVGRESVWQQTNSVNLVPDLAPRTSFAPSRKASPEKPVSESSKCVLPPPPVETPVKSDDTTKDIDCSSVASFEAPYSMAASILANPPTPLTDATKATLTIPDQLVPPLPSKDKDRVRHSRDRDYAREVREHDKDYIHDHKVRDSRDRSHRDRESTTHSEKKRDSKAHSQPMTEADSRHRHRTRKVSNLGEGERSTTVPKVLSPPVLESDKRRHEHNAVQHDSKRGERYQEDREPKSTRKRHEPSATAVNISTAQTLPLLPTQDIPVSRPLDRHPSLSTRPTSQLPSADEINAMRAREAWDMERLWKARSMQGDELNGYTTIPSNHNTPVMTYVNSPVATNLHGSSHTSFVQQKTQHSIYHSMPAVPPPIIYPPLSIPTVAHQNLPTSHRQARTRIYAESITSDGKSYTSVRTSNPLPEIPRESSYEIPAEARNSEYWTKYAGLTTTT
ncbi:hypothetical protein C0993_009547 [Termitomyces sp. T159_Od127]|nr:hypothetical protein C0993_009547 [Termitomyces sp. T159_Od127]